MSQKITNEVVQKIADLAKLKLTTQEVSQYAQQFAVIFEHFEKLAKVNTDGVAPMVTPSRIEHYHRPDESVMGLGGEKSVANAPSKQGNLFKVPPVVG